MTSATSLSTVSFPSKVDWPLTVIVFGAMAFGLVIALLSPAPRVALGPAAALALMIWIWTGTLYTFDGDDLVIRCGPMRRRVPVREIIRVRRSRTWLSSPALSLDRLEVSGAFGVAVVSPKDVSGFVDAIRQRAPRVALDGI